MKFVFDHDLHIHSRLSSCSTSDEQTPQRILEYAEEYGLNTVCITDHFWDEKLEGASGWYKPQNFEHISLAKPLPQKDGIRFLFGCETEMNRFNTIGVSKERFDEFDFIIVPTTHFHMRGYTLFEEQTETAEARAIAWVNRLDNFFSQDLPFHKIGLAHLTCSLIANPRGEFIKTIDLIPEEELHRVFKKAAELMVGIELNAHDMGYSESERDTVLRPYRIAKQEGCKFYCGSDAHIPKEFGWVKNYEKAIRDLELCESDKFDLASL